MSSWSSACSSLETSAQRFMWHLTSFFRTWPWLSLRSTAKLPGHSYATLCGTPNQLKCDVWIKVLNKRHRIEWVMSYFYLFESIMNVSKNFCHDNLKALYWILTEISLKLINNFLPTLTKKNKKYSKWIKINLLLHKPWTLGWLIFYTGSYRFQNRNRPGPHAQQSTEYRSDMTWPDISAIIIIIFLGLFFYLFLHLWPLDWLCNHFNLI